MMKKIVFFQIGPGIGPITNNNFRFAKSLNLLNTEIELLGTNVDQKVYHASPDCVHVSSLKASSFRKILLPLIKFLKSKKPDVLLASGPSLHVVTCIAKRITGYPKILVIRIHAHTSSLVEDRRWLNRKILLWLMKHTHQWADYKVSASRGAALDWADLLKIDKDDIEVMYNPAVGEDVLEKSMHPVIHPWLNHNETPVLITVARLEKQKSIDVLLHAFSLVLKEKEVKLIIVGDGSLKKELESLAITLGIKEHVDFYGWVENPYALMSKADLFVLSSWYEGFANVIAEALACGCPVVSTNAPSGPSEILEDGKYGRLVPVGDIHSLASSILTSLSEPVDKEFLKKRGMDFHVDKIIDDSKRFFGM